MKILFCSAFLITMGTQLSAQEQDVPVLADFLIKIEASKDQIKLKCMTGCDWKELQYSTTTANLLQAISRSGMADLTERDFLRNEDSTNFIFTLERTNSGLILQSLEGTAWRNLSFTCPQGECSQLIDQMGMSRSK